MLKRVLFLILYAFFPYTLFSQKITISGYVQDSITGEVLPGANVFYPTTNQGTTTNNYGYYCLNLVPSNDTIRIVATFIGYKPLIASVFIKRIANKPISNNFLLQSGVELQEVILKFNRDENNQIGLVKIPAQQIKLLPSIGGEVDVMKAFQLMPGIQRGAEGSSGIFVRGGSPDQNLILLDDVPLYYVNHAGGFFSIFDENALSDIHLIKSGFPARYGGRLSSVMDIKMKEGDLYKYRGIVSLGLLISKFSVEGPIQKGKSSFFISARRCNLDLLTRTLLYITNDDARTGYAFYDINFKVNHKFSERNRVFFSFYYGDDVMFYKLKGKRTNQITPAISETINYAHSWDNRWGNILSNLRFNHVFSPRLFTNISMSYMKYRYNYENKFNRENSENNKIEKSNDQYKSGITDLLVKSNFDFFINDRNHMKFGLSSVYHTFNPGCYTYYALKDTLATQTTLDQQKVYSVENVVYIENEAKITSKLMVNIGFHYSSYLLKTNAFHSFEPRISINYQIAKNTTLNSSFTKMKQYVHLLSNSNVGMAYDMWLPSTGIVKPENATQYTLGANQDFFDRKYSTTIETYYKTMRNLIDFKEGASFMEGDADWKNRVETDGIGTTYGLELLIKKNTGKLAGWFSYTLSKNSRQFSQLNLGNTFPFRYDRRHNIAFVMNYQFSKSLNLSANWLFSSGEAMTLGVSKYTIQNEYVESSKGFYYINDVAYNYGSKNNFRLPPYHRLDVSLSYTKEKSKGKAEWNFGVYNLYNNKNPYLLYFESNKYNQIKLYKLCVFPILPSVAYRFYF